MRYIKVLFIVSILILVFGMFCSCKKDADSQPASKSDVTTTKKPNSIFVKPTTAPSSTISDTFDSKNNSGNKNETTLPLQTVSPDDKSSNGAFLTTPSVTGNSKEQDDKNNYDSKNPQGNTPVPTPTPNKKKTKD